MTKVQNFSDEELTAYLDGEATPLLVDQIESALSNRSNLQTRLNALTIDVKQLRDSFDALLDLAPAPTVLDENITGKMAQSKIPWAKIQWVAMAACVMIALGVGWTSALLTSRPAGPDGWRGYVAAYQALYTTATLASVNQTDAKASAELMRVAAAIGREFNLDTISAGPGLTYKRAQILSFEKRPLIQLAFLTANGTPVALCIIKTAKTSKTVMQQGQMEEMRSAHWSKNGYEFLLIGGDDQAVIEQAAKYYAARI